MTILWVRGEGRFGSRGITVDGGVKNSVYSNITDSSLYFKLLEILTLGKKEVAYN